MADIPPLLAFKKACINPVFYYCEGNYVVIIAVMSELPTTDNPVLQDYVQPAATIVDPGMPNE